MRAWILRIGSGFELPNECLASRFWVGGTDFRDAHLRDWLWNYGVDWGSVWGLVLISAEKFVDGIAVVVGA